MKKISLIIFFVLNFSQVSPQNNEGYKKFKNEKFNTKFHMLNSVLFGGIDQKGLSFRSRFKKNHLSWKRLNKKILTIVENDSCKSTDCSNYVHDYAKSTNSNISYSYNTYILYSGIDGFNKQLKLIKEAKKSIYISTWAIYDDETGFLLKEKLLEKVRTNKLIDIRIIVDGQVSERKLHNKILDNLEIESEGLIKIIRWRTKPYRANGNHRKLFIVDGLKCVLGGKNYGNMYSHISGAVFWQDVDVFIDGSAAMDTYNIFAEIWNEQVKNNKLVKYFDLIPKVSKVNRAPNLLKTIPVVINNHNPGTKNRKADQNITTGIVKLISEAKKSIVIENAYFIMTTPFKSAIKKAIHKGVKIRLLTNSEASLNEVVLSNPILTSSLEAAKLGVEVYLKKGASLHSKYLVVDDKIAMVGSFNFQPRSYYYEGELVAVFFDTIISKKLVNKFNENIKPEKADKLINRDIQIKDNFRAKLARIFFFNQL